MKVALVIVSIVAILAIIGFAVVLFNCGAEIREIWTETLAEADEVRRTCLAAWGAEVGIANP